jgi:putative tricarboxylic transport membrane protein
VSHLHRRPVLRLLAAMGLAVAAAWGTAPAHAEINGLEIIAPANPGSGYDQAARAMQQALEQEGLASGVQVVNIPGAGGTVGLAQFVSGKKRSPTLMVTAFSMVGAIITNKAPVSLDNADPLALLVREYGILTVPANSDIKSMADLVAKLKADPSSVSWGLGSSGGVDHVLAGQILKAIGIESTKLKAAHYAAGGEQVAAILGGHLTVAVGGVSEFGPQVEAGALRAIAVSSPERLPVVDAPTLKEQGVDVELGTWRGVMAHPQMRDADKKAVTEAIAAMVKTPTWQDTLTKFGWIASYEPADQFADFLKQQQDLIAGALRDLGLTS